VDRNKIKNIAGGNDPPSMDQCYWRQSHPPLLACTYEQYK